ncbi:MAG: STAS domain-containing protein [Planctomycetota bacterium]
MTAAEERGHVLATRDDQVVYFQLVGLNNLNNCTPFEAYSIEMQASGYRKFVLDFSACRGVDSTFVGLLLELARGRDFGRACEVIIINPRDTVLRSLREVGVDRILTVLGNPVAVPGLPLQRLDAPQPSPRERARTSLRAHESLCRFDPSNLERFGQFLSMLRAERDRVCGPALTGDAS